MDRENRTTPTDTPPTLDDSPIQYVDLDDSPWWVVWGLRLMLVVVIVGVILIFSAMVYYATID